MEISFWNKTKLFIVHQFIRCLNFILKISNRILFFRLGNKPRNILILKVGNIGDIVCAVPALLSIHKAYSEAKITLLTSPGKKELPGAKELLTGAPYLDELKIYYDQDINSFRKIKNFIAGLRKNHYDLFIHLPDDLAGFVRVFRNMVFAKFIGAKHAFGFKVRSLRIFKKTQVDYLFHTTEVESLIEILKENGILVSAIEFSLPISDSQKKKVADLFPEGWLKRGAVARLIVAVSPGGKKEENRWPAERFGEVVRYLKGKYGAKIIVVGSEQDIPLAETIGSQLKKEDFLTAAGKLHILETAELLKYCSLVISNNTGIVHLAAAVKIPVVGIYGVGDINLGRWFPYGDKHKILFRRFLDCDYNKSECVKKSTLAVSVGEVIAACDEIIAQLK